MDFTAANLQPVDGGAMATPEIAYLRGELEQRRARLVDATHENVSDTSLRQLLGSVDAALARIKKAPTESARPVTNRSKPIASYAILSCASVSIIFPPKNSALSKMIW